MKSTVNFIQCDKDEFEKIKDRYSDNIVFLPKEQKIYFEGTYFDVNADTNMFRNLEIFIKQCGSEHGGNYTIYNKNNSDERIDYAEDTTLMTYTDDNYKNTEETLNIATEDRLTELFIKFGSVGTSKI